MSPGGNVGGPRFVPVERSPLYVTDAERDQLRAVEALVSRDYVPTCAGKYTLDRSGPLGPNRKHARCSRIAFEALLVRPALLAFGENG
jgi:hypothetical protein